MTLYGVLPTGFKRKRYSDLIESMNARAKELFGAEIDISENTYLGKEIRLHAWFLSEVWETSESVYNSISLDSATGVQIDKLIKYKGLKRHSAKKATGAIQIVGSPGINIPYGFIVAKQTGAQYRNLEQGTIPANGVLVLEVEAVMPSINGNASVGEVNVIITPITNIQSVTNVLPILGGQNDETDLEVVLRYFQTTGGSSTLSAIRSAISKVDGVMSYKVFENVQQITDSSGRPPKSVEAIVYGGIDKDIAESIMNSKAAGIQAYGQTYANITDDAGDTQTIGFTRPNEIDIDMRVQIKVNAQFPINGISKVKTQLINYIGGEDEDGTIFKGLGISDTVNHSYCIATVWGIVGVTDVAALLKKSTATVLSPQDIELNDYEKAITDFNKVVVEIVS